MTFMSRFHIWIPAFAGMTFGFHQYDGNKQFFTDTAWWIDRLEITDKGKIT
jgi:hypothetical protein